jgi:ABC-2 type transport system permease protein
MKLALSYFKLYFTSTMRHPPALFFTLIFPPLMLLLSAHQWNTTPESQWHAFALFLNYSVQTICLMLLGMGVSSEKNSQWSHYVRTLPTSLWSMVSGRILHTLFLCLLNLVSIVLLCVFVFSVPVTLAQVLSFVSVALIGGIPMALMGMTIGYASHPDSSRSIFTLLNLLLLFGAFSLPNTGIFAYINQIIPTYQWNQISLRIVSPNISLTSPLICLACYVMVFAFLFQKTYFKSKTK